MVFLIYTGKLLAGKAVVKADLYELLKWNDELWINRAGKRVKTYFKW